MKKFFIEKLYDGESWHHNVIVKVTQNGYIDSVKKGIKSDARHLLGLVIPGLHNAHSHAFQRVMAGWCERRHSAQDSFWSWRTQMYNLARKITPEINQKICQWLFVECLEAGFTSHCEFHYLHKPHCTSENKQDQLRAAIQMSNSVTNAAARVKMPICLMPVLYQQSQPYKPSTEEQKPFIFDEIDDYLEFLDSIKNVNLAFGLHSLRAVKKESLDQFEAISCEAGWRELPIHIHISEQPLEVEQIKAAYGSSPLEYLNSRVTLNSRWNLVHATHFTDSESQIAIANECNIVLCPITEANLGDGVFRLKAFHEDGGNYTIGSDSNVMIEPFQELAILEYGQRLRSGKRITVADSGSGSCAEALFRKVQKSAEASCGMKVGLLKKGYLANFLSLRIDHPSLLAVAQTNLLDAIIFSAGKSCVLEVYLNGECVVEDGKYKMRDELFIEYKECIESLRGIS